MMMVSELALRVWWSTIQMTPRMVTTRSILFLKLQRSATRLNFYINLKETR